MGAMDEMMEAMMGSMSKEEKMEMGGAMMVKFFAGMTTEDKQKMMEQMMPKMMEGVNMMEMMPKMMMGMMGSGESGGGMMGMMARGQGKGMPMMPHCLNMMLPGVPMEERVDFVLNMITALMEQGSAGMSEEEKSEFVAKILERVTS